MPLQQLDTVTHQNVTLCVALNPHRYHTQVELPGQAGYRSQQRNAATLAIIEPLNKVRFKLDGGDGQFLQVADGDMSRTEVIERYLTPQPAQPLKRRIRLRVLLQQNTLADLETHQSRRKVMRLEPAGHPHGKILLQELPCGKVDIDGSRLLTGTPPGGELYAYLLEHMISKLLQQPGLLGQQDDVSR